MKRIALLALLSAACGRGEQPELTVYAAASLRDALQEIGALHERRGGMPIVFNFGSSGDLSRQIVAARGADLFFSADERELDRVEKAGLVEPGTRRAVLSNQLVVIEPASASVSPFTAPFDPAQLAQPSIDPISLANPDTVPAGEYARAWLTSRGAWEAVAPKVLPGVDVRAALSAVESGGARAGIVYRTDALRSTKVRIVFAVPPEEAPRISYGLAVISGRPYGERAREVADLFASDEARAIFVRHGFVAPGG